MTASAAKQAVTSQHPRIDASALALKIVSTKTRGKGIETGSGRRKIFWSARKCFQGVSIGAELVRRIDIHLRSASLARLKRLLFGPWSDTRMGTIPSPGAGAEGETDSGGWSCFSGHQCCLAFTSFPC